jgi:hypothetical protein
MMITVEVPSLTGKSPTVSSFVHWVSEPGARCIVVYDGPMPSWIWMVAPVL